MNIENLFNETNQLLTQELSNNQYNQQTSSAFIEKLNRLTKNAEPIFIRVTENVNRVIYEQQKYLKQLEADVKNQKDNFKLGLYSTTIFILTFGFILFWAIGSHIRTITNELKTEKNKALDATQSKSLFLANMSHEIRTPLNAISGFIELLIDKEKDNEKLKQLNIIENSSRNLISIINDILDFSKIESNKLEIDIIDFNPKKEFQAVAELFNTKSSEKNLTLITDISDDLPESLHSDPLRIKQVVSNLLSNAIKFSQKDKTIRFEVKYNEQHSELYVAVIDQGIGIPEDKQKQIFEAFSQAESSTTREFGGTGLGLSISSLLIELLGGTLKVESTENVGSKFYFTLPVKLGKPIIHKTAETFSAVDQSSRILLVEDNKTNQILMGAILKKMNLSFTLAEDGVEAIEAIKSNTFDLVLMDENMPRMSGTEATLEIRAWEKTQQQHTPIVALTANAMKGDKERFLATGMDDYLTKPLKLPELNRILNTYLMLDTQNN